MKILLIISCTILAVLATLTPVGIYILHRRKARATQSPDLHGDSREPKSPTIQKAVSVLEECVILKEVMSKEDNETCEDDMRICEVHPLEKGHANFCWIKSQEGTTR